MLNKRLNKVKKNVIPVDIKYTATYNPQVVLHAHGQKTKCVQDCKFKKNTLIFLLALTCVIQKTCKIRVLLKKETCVNLTLQQKLTKLLFNILFFLSSFNYWRQIYWRKTRF